MTTSIETSSLVNSIATTLSASTSIETSSIANSLAMTSSDSTSIGIETSLANSIASTSIKTSSSITVTTSFSTQSISSSNNNSTINMAHTSGAINTILSKNMNSSAETTRQTQLSTFLSSASRSLQGLNSTGPNINLFANVTSLLASLSSTPFSMSSLSAQDNAVLLSSKLDLSDCLVNCTNNGLCQVSQDKLVCECNAGYMGNKCQATSSPCSYSPCLNNATCMDSVQNSTNATEYNCRCSSSLYYGPQCQYKIDLCQNQTCSSKGYCKETNENASCKCFPNYSGSECEITSTT
jgi:hypothetical protein